MGETDSAQVHEPQGERQGLGELLRRLISSFRRLVYAEIDLLQANYAQKVRQLAQAAIAAAVGAVVCISALASLLVGLIIAFAPEIGPFAATFAVSLTAIAVGVLTIVIATRSIRKNLTLQLNDEPDETLMEHDDGHVSPQ